MSWEEPPPRRRVSPSVIAVLALVAVGATLALATTVGGSPDDRLAVDSDADADEAAAAEEGERDGPEDEDVFGDEPEPEPEEVEPVEEPPDDDRSDQGVEVTELDLSFPEETGLQVFMQTHRGRLVRIDLDTGQMTDRRVGSITPSRMHLVGDRLLLEQQGRIVSLDPDLEGKTEPLIEGHRTYPASEDANEVWVARPGRGLGGAGEIVKVAVDSGETLATHEVPASQVLGAHGDELVVEQHGHISVQHLETGEGRSIGTGRALSYRAGRVAWMDCGPDLTCDLVTSDIDGAEERRVPVEDADYVPLHEAALSPNGDVFLTATRSESGQLTVAAISTLDGTVTEIDGMAGYVGRMAWAPDSSWAFIESPTGGLLAWRSEDGETVMIEHGHRDGLVAIAVR